MCSSAGPSPAALKGSSSIRCANLTHATRWKQEFCNDVFYASSHPCTIVLNSQTCRLRRIEDQFSRSHGEGAENHLWREDSRAALDPAKTGNDFRVKGSVTDERHGPQGQVRVSCFSMPPTGAAPPPVPPNDKRCGQPPAGLRGERSDRLRAGWARTSRCADWQRAPAFV